MKLYDLLPLIIRLRDAEASGGFSIDPILKKITDATLQEEADEFIALAVAMKDLYDYLKAGSEYRSMLFYLLGQQVAEGWYESLERFMLSGSVAWHKISGTVFGWDRANIYRAASSYSFTELFKTEPNEEADYNTHRNSTFPYKSSRIAVSPVGLFPYDWSSDTIVCVPPYTPQPTVEPEPEPEPTVIDYDVTSIDYDYREFTAGQKIISTERGVDFQFGYDVAAIEDDLLIGERRWTEDGSDTFEGRVSVYRKVDGVWEFVTALRKDADETLASGQTWFQVGSSVLTSNGYVAVTELLGPTLIFQRETDGTYTRRGSLDVSPATINRRAVGIGKHEATGKCYAVTFFGDSGNEAIRFYQETGLPTGDAFEQIGADIPLAGIHRITASGNYVAVSRHLLSIDGVPNVGQVDIYEVSASGADLQINHLSALTWPHQAAAVAYAVSQGDTGPEFGYGLQLNGSTLVVSAKWPYVTVPTNNEGQVTFFGGCFVFIDSTGDGNFVYSHMLKRTYPAELNTGTDSSSLSIFDASTLEMHGDFITLTAWGNRWDENFENFSSKPDGAITIFRATPYNHEEVQTLTPFGFRGRQYDPKTTAFGNGIASTSDTLFVGTPNDDYDELGGNGVENAGAVYTFNRNAVLVTEPDDRIVVVCEDFAIIPIGGLDTTYAADDTSAVTIDGSLYPQQPVLTPPSSFVGPYDMIGVRFRAYSETVATIRVNHALAQGELNDRTATITDTGAQVYEVWWNAEDFWGELISSINWSQFWVQFQSDQEAHITAAELVVRRVYSVEEYEVAEETTTYRISEAQDTGTFTTEIPSSTVGTVSPNRYSLSNTAIIARSHTSTSESGGSYLALTTINQPFWVFKNVALGDPDSIRNATLYLSSVDEPSYNDTYVPIFMTGMLPPYEVGDVDYFVNVRNYYVYSSTSEESNAMRFDVKPRTFDVTFRLQRLLHSKAISSGDPLVFFGSVRAHSLDFEYHYGKYAASLVITQDVIKPVVNSSESCLQACECLCQTGCEVACQLTDETTCISTCESVCQTELELAVCKGQCQVTTQGLFSLPPHDPTGDPDLQYELEACFEINKCLGNTLRYSEAMRILNAYFRDQRPIHVLPVYCVTIADLPEVASQPVDDLYTRVVGRFQDKASTPGYDSLVIVPSCTQGCMVSCQTFCEVGCETDCQGAGACENSCQLRCEANCQTDCEVVCQAGCVISCQSDACQSYCQGACEGVCQVSCENTCQGSCEIVGCQLSCTSGCQDFCEFDCQIACEFDCQSPTEIGCQTSCQDACQTCCQDSCEGVGCQTTCELDCQASCVSGCETSCETNCQDACQGACQSTCEFNCQADCQGVGCEVGCEGGCQGGCQGSCEVTCEGASCQAACESSGCQGCCECQCQSSGCEESCTSGCTTGCQTACESSCQASGGCETSCEASCEGSSESCSDCCEACCESYTEGSCSDACETECQYACQANCQAGVEPGCETICQDSCTAGGCQAGIEPDCQLTCQDSCVYECQYSYTEGCSGVES